MESFLKLLIHTDEKCSYKRRSISFSHIVVFIGTWISRQLCSIRQWWQIYGVSGEWVSGHLACHLITAIQKMLGRVHMFCSPSCGHFASLIGNTTTTWWCYMLYLLHCVIVEIPKLRMEEKRSVFAVFDELVLIMAPPPPVHLCTCVN